MHRSIFSVPWAISHCSPASLFRPISYLYQTGLFTADQNLKGDTAIFTRQNANGNRRGLEVPEERDYYPYWGPTPWKDIAIMVSNKDTEKIIKDHVNSPNYGYSGKLVF